MTPDPVRDRADQAAAQTDDGGSDPLLHELVPMQNLLYGVLLTVTHPSLPREQISSELGLVPQQAWTAGDERRTPGGSLLSGLRPSTYWCFSKQVLDQRAFFRSVEQLVDLLERHADFPRAIVDGGGEISITVQLPGRRNIGSVLPASELGRMAALKVSLGIEVFPDMRS